MQHSAGLLHLLFVAWYLAGFFNKRLKRFFFIPKNGIIINT